MEPRKRSLKEKLGRRGASSTPRFLESHFTSAISAEDSEWTNKEWMETNRWLDSRIAEEKGVPRGKEILRCSGGTFTIRRGTKRLESVDEKAKEKGTRRGMKTERGGRGGIREENEVEEEERKTKKKSRSLESRESHLRSPHNHNKLKPRHLTTGGYIAPALGRACPRWRGECS